MMVQKTNNPIHPKADPIAYYDRYQNSLGEDTIYVYYCDYSFDPKYKDYSSVGPLRYDRWIEVKVNLSLGMLPGFFLFGFDYALERNGEVCWLELAYRNGNLMEFGFFHDVPNLNSRSIAEIPEHLHLWVR